MMRSGCIAALSNALGRRSSVDDIEGKAQRSVEFRAFDLVKMAHSTFVKITQGHSDHVVATNHARFRKPFVGTDLDFRPDPTNRSSDWRACHGGQH